MTFEPALDDAFRTVGRGIAAARRAEIEDLSLEMIDIAPEVAPLDDAQRARMIESLGRQLQGDVVPRGAPWSAWVPASRFPRH